MGGIIDSSEDVCNSGSGFWPVIDINAFDEIKFKTNTAPPMIWEADENGNKVFFNSALLKFTNNSVSNLLNGGWKKSIHPDDLEAYEKNYSSCLEKKTGYSYKYRLLSNKGDYKIVIENAEPRYLNGEEFLGFLASVTDVSECYVAEKKVKDSSQLISFVLDHFPGLVFWKDKNSVYLGCNRDFARITGIESEYEIIGQTDDLFCVKREEAEIFRRDDREVFATGEQKLNLIRHLTNKKGGRYWFETSKMPLRDSEGNVFGVMGISRDITDRVNFENKIKKQLLIAQASNYISHVIIREKESEKIFTQITKILGSAIKADTILIYEIKNECGKAFKLKEWNKNAISKEKIKNAPDEIQASRLSRFFRNSKKHIFSFRNKINRLLIDDNLDFVFHRELGINYLTISPFNYVNGGFFFFVVGRNSIKKKWQGEDMAFIKATGEQLTIGLQKSALISEKETVKLSLKTREATLRTLVEAIPDRIVFKDFAGKWITANKSALSLLKLSMSEVIGKTDEEISAKAPYTKGILEIFSQGDEEIRKKNIPILVTEEVLPDDSGRFVFFETTRVMIYNERELPEGLLIIRRDITQKKWSDMELSKFSLAVRESSASIIITDYLGKIEYVNPKFTQTTGYSLEEVKGRNPGILNSGTHPKRYFKSLWDTILSGNEWYGEILNRRKDGSLYWELETISPVRGKNGVITHFVSVKEDISQKKEMEFELKRALDKAEESDRLKSSLLANMSHEFRTPMNGILGLTAILKDMIENQQQLKMLEGIYISGKRLMNILDAILELADLEAHKNTKDYAPVNISNIATGIYNEFKIRAENKKLSLVFSIKDETLCVRAQIKNIQQVFYQLLDNAVKFTDKGQIEFSIDSIERDGLLFGRITVRDTGIGISEENQLLIFEEFRQVSEGLSRIYEGAGIGLSLVKKIVNLLDGKIFIESELKAGTKFQVLLPAIKAETFYNELGRNEKIFDNANGLKEKNQKVLLVEDNPLNTEVTEAFLKNYCSLDFASDGKGAMEKIKAEKYDIILMDINLGIGLSGKEISKEIRKIKDYENTPIVAITGYATNSDKKSLLSGEFTHFLAKPFEKEQLIELLERISKNISG
jgi:PAS domain S-box-containing protein